MSGVLGVCLEDERGARILHESSGSYFTMLSRLAGKQRVVEEMVSALTFRRENEGIGQYYMDYVSLTDLQHAPLSKQKKLPLVSSWPSKSKFEAKTFASAIVTVARGNGRVKL